MGGRTLVKGGMRRIAELPGLERDDGDEPRTVEVVTKSALEVDIVKEQ